MKTSRGQSGPHGDCLRCTGLLTDTGRWWCCCSPSLWSIPAISWDLGWDRLFLCVGLLGWSDKDFHPTTSPHHHKPSLSHDESSEFRHGDCPISSSDWRITLMIVFMFFLTIRYVSWPDVPEENSDHQTLTFLFIELGKKSVCQTSKTGFIINW